MADQPIHALHFEPPTGASLSGILQNSLLAHPHPDVRAAALHALGSILFSFLPGSPEATRRQDALQAALHAAARPLNEHYLIELNTADLLCDLSDDAAPVVRAELVASLARFLSGHMAGVLAAVADFQGFLQPSAPCAPCTPSPPCTAAPGATPATPPRHNPLAPPHTPPTSPSGPGAATPQAPEDDYYIHRRVLDTLLQLSTDPEPAVAAAAAHALSLAGLTVRPAPPTPIPSTPTIRDLHFRPPPGHPALALAPPELPRPPTCGPPPSLASLDAHPPGFPESPFATRMVALFARPLFQPAAARWLSLQAQSPAPPPASTPTPTPVLKSTPALKFALAPAPTAAPAPTPTPTPTTDSSPPVEPKTPEYPESPAPPRCPTPAPQDHDKTPIPFQCDGIDDNAAAPKRLLLATIPSSPSHPPPTPHFHPTQPLLLLASHPTTLHSLPYPLPPPCHAPIPLPTPHPTPSRALVRPAALYSTLPGPPTTLLSCGTDGTCYIYNLTPSGPPALLTAWDTRAPTPYAIHRPSLFAHHPHTPTLFSADPLSPTVTAWDLTTQQATLQLTPTHTPPALLAPGASPPLLLSATPDQIVRIYDTRIASHSAQVHTIPPPAPSQQILSILSSPCGLPHLVAVSRSNGSIALHDIRHSPATPPATLPATPPAPATRCSMASVAGLLCTASDAEDVVRFWDLSGGTAAEVAGMRLHAGGKGVHCLAVDSSRSLVAAGGLDGTCGVWRV